MLVTNKELSNLLSILSSKDATHEQIVQRIERSFHKAELFKVWSALALLVKDNVLGDIERLNALYLLYHVNNNDSNSPADVTLNPFLPLFLELAESKHVAPVELFFISKLFEASRKRVKAFPKTTAQNTLASFNASKLEISKTVEGPPVKELLAKYASSVESVGTLASQWKRNAVYRVVYDPKPSDEVAVAAASQQRSKGYKDSHPALQSDGLQSKQLTLGGFEPRWIRPSPPRYESNEEVTWLDVDGTTFRVVWDIALNIESNPLEELRKLMSQAFEEPLLGSEQSLVLEKLDDNPDLVHSCGVTPGRLPDLVENNPGIAIEVLLKLMSSEQIAEYFSVLVNMDMTLHSMEVVNRLTTAVELPTEFIHLYISNCIRSCEKIEDKFMQNRLVRLVCVFLQALIRNNTINVQELLAEVQAFCIEFSKIREAAGLYRMLKTMEGADSASDGGDGAHDSSGDNGGDSNSDQ